jgi:hypothetical protein
MRLWWLYVLDNRMYEGRVTVRKGAIRSLRSRSLKLRRSLATEIIEIRPALFLARAPDLQILLSATGRTPTAAMNRLAIGIAWQYNLLAARPNREGVALQATALRSMRRFIVEDNSLDESASSRRKAQRKTRLHRKP